jgi:DNA-binding MarR family transcriptional regulator
MAKNIWNPLGIKSSPFFQEALDISETSLWPISLFVGRTAESEEALSRIIGGRSSRIVVAGLPGSGKTTFIQYVKSSLDGQGYAVSSGFCRVPHRLSVTDLGVELLRSVVTSMHNALLPKLLKKIDGFEEARTLVSQRRRLAWQASATVLGTGGGVGVNPQPQVPAFSPNQFQDALARLVASAMGAGVPGIVVHLNNLENLEEDPAAASILLRDARDYFLVPGLHVLLGATLDFHGSVLSRHAQVRSIFPPPLRLEPMNFKDVKEILRRRYAYLKIEKMKVTRPVSWPLVEEFHRLFHGDLRGMLSALDETCYRALGSTGTAPLDRDQALPSLMPLYRRELEDTLSEINLKHLKRLVEFEGSEFRQTDVVNHLGLSQPRVSGLFNDMERAQAILLARTDGPSRYYALSGRARIAFGKV